MKVEYVLFENKTGKVFLGKLMYKDTCYSVKHVNHCYGIYVFDPEKAFHLNQYHLLEIFNYLPTQDDYVEYLI